MSPLVPPGGLVRGGVSGSVWTPPGTAPAGTRVVIGIGELAVSGDRGDVLITHALGSCIAVCIWDPTACVAGLLHFLLPDSRINPTRAGEQPAAFADTGVPLLFQTAYRQGLLKNRAVVRLVGGAEIAGHGASFDIGKRNLLAAKNLLWRNGVLIKGEAVGGKMVRTVNLAVADGRLRITSGREQVDEL
ncbi:MAG: chemotaxis protein CheD [Acidobacteria bacterium]|nr:chemotaxis protein CheD [Acidobacteriota bacterium]